MADCIKNLTSDDLSVQYMGRMEVLKGGQTRIVDHTLAHCFDHDHLGKVHMTSVTADKLREMADAVEKKVLEYDKMMTSTKPQTEEEKKIHWKTKQKMEREAREMGQGAGPVED